jgi:hypothetical protein
MTDPFAQLAEGSRTIARLALRARLRETARIAARSDSEGGDGEARVELYKRTLADVCTMLDQSVAVCAIEHAERQGLIDAWIRTEARFWLYQLPPAERREKLLDLAPGPQRFIALWTRRLMLREIDEELRWGKAPGSAVTARTE